MVAVQRTVSVTALHRAGAYHVLAFAAPEIAAGTRPGHFVALAVGGPASALVTRRAFSVYRADTGAGTVTIVFAVAGAGTAWLADRRVGDVLDVVGPLGRPFDLASDTARAPGTAGSAGGAGPGGPAVLVGGGYGAAPLIGLAARLTAAGTGVTAVLGAATAGRLFGAEEARAAGATVVCTTEDGSAGLTGRVTDVLPPLLSGAATAAAAVRPTASAGAAGLTGSAGAPGLTSSAGSPGSPGSAGRGAGAVYACGPMAMLAAVAGLAAEHGVPAQVAVEETMACGVGVCMTCVLPVVGRDGVTRMSRACVDGPVFAGGSVRFAAVGTVPADVFGAPGTAR
jgi:dihydroorotate dehydrogenase electron transfer subunit